MSIRFLADENLLEAIIQGLRSREPSIDILDVKTSGLRRTKDPDLLEMAYQQDRILITHDRDTMPGHFWDRLSAGKRNSPGAFVVPQRCAVGATVDFLLLV